MSDYVLARYIWIDGMGGYRCKTKTLFNVAPEDLVPEKLEEWNYDGSSTGQAEGHDSEVMLKPCAVYKDPVRGNGNILVMCSTYSYSTGLPLATNHRHWAETVFCQKTEEEPWYGLEQEYFMMKKNGTFKAVEPLCDGIPEGQGQYYCSVGAQNLMGRDLVEEHYIACLEAGLRVSGINGEVAVAQWEYQIGPVTGIEAGDQLHISRFLLILLAEKYDIVITFHPKPLLHGCWNGSGCHANFSTASMRKEGGLAVINEAIEKLSKTHKEHIDVYGDFNELRLTGHHETASINEFRAGVADRGASIRIPRLTEKIGYGYLEDRRPSSNMDPYLVCGKLFETCVLRTEF